MGLEYRILCPCFREGKFDKEKAPHPEFLQWKEDRGYFYDDQAIEEAARADDIWDDIDAWKIDICEHGWVLEEGHICNFNTQMAIYQVLYQLLPREEFPTISRYYPIMNDGGVPLAYNQKMQEELEQLCSFTMDILVLGPEIEGRLKASHMVKAGDFRILAVDDGKVSFVNESGFFIVAEAAKTYDDLSEYTDEDFIAALLDGESFTLLFQALELEKTQNSLGENVYLNLANRTLYESARDFLPDPHHDAPGIYKVQQGLYSFQIYEGVFRVIQEILSLAQLKQADVEWC